MQHLATSVLVLFCFFKVALVTCSKPTNEYQTLNGYGNNKFNALWGSAGTLDGAYAFNLVPPAYSDSIGTPADYGGPGARTISWSLFNSSFRYASEAGTNDLVPYFGQFICHDIADQPGGGPRFDIPVDHCDPFFDRECVGNKSIPFTRSKMIIGERGYKVATNIVSTWIDAGVVYGPDMTRLGQLRTWSGGLLRVSKGPHGDLLPPDNLTQMANGGYYLAGDNRANVNLPMVCLHTLFYLEHNSRARKLAQANPNWDDETLFQESRRFVIAMLQKIHFTEYLPAILGKPLDTYEGYDRDVDPRVDTTFMTAAFRYGHSASSPLVFRIGEDWHPVPDGHLSLGPTIFNPVEIKENGMDSLLRGFVMQPESDVDVSAPSDIRNNHHILLDLVATDIQRNRDRGVASFNNLRRAIGENPYTSWAELTPDTDVQAALARVYDDIEQMDAYVGGLAERPIERGAIPPTFSTLIEDYFSRLRAADRFHYENPGVLSASELKEVQSRSLSDMVREHTDIDHITNNMFGLQSLDSECAAPTDSTGGNSSDGSSGSYTVTSGFDVKWEVFSATNLIRFTISSTLIAQDGWVGIGIGSNQMIGSDFHVGFFKDTWQVIDGHSTGGGNVDIDDENSLTIGECSFLDDTMTIIFERPLTATTSEQDSAIVENSYVDVIFAYGSSAFPSYHGYSSKFETQLILWKGSNSDAPAPAPAPANVDIKWLSLTVHGVSMSLIWLVFIPLGIFVVRFRKGEKNSMETHQSLSQIGAMGILSFVATAVGAKGGFDFSSTHARIGIPICFVLILQILAGWTVRLLLPRSHNMDAIRISRRLHGILGTGLFLVAVANCYLGLRFFVEPSHPVAIAFVIYLVAFTSLFVGLEAKRYIANTWRTNIDSGINGKVKMATMTYAEFVKRVEHGQQLIMIGKNVYNIRDFIKKHPGGSHVLIENVGTDCTNIFDSVHKHSVAAVTLMNRRLLVGHCHETTRHAGKLVGDSDMCLCDVSICSLHFKRYRMVSKETIGGDEECPIVLFRIQIKKYKLQRASSFAGISNLVTSAKQSYLFAGDPSIRKRSKTMHVSSGSKKRKQIMPIDAAVPPETSEEKLNNFDGVETLPENSDAEKMQAAVLGNTYVKTEADSTKRDSIDSTAEAWTANDSTIARNSLMEAPVVLRPKTTKKGPKRDSTRHSIFGKITGLMTSPNSTPEQVQEGVNEHLDNINGKNYTFFASVRDESVVRKYTPIAVVHIEGHVYMDFCIKLYPVGQMSSHLRALKPGRFIRMRGPQGLTVKNRDMLHGGWNRLVLIAGGTGITPMLAIAKDHVTGKYGTGQVDVIYQVRLKFKAVYSPQRTFRPSLVASIKVHC